MAAGIFQELHAAIVPVKDLEASVRWYRETLELEPVREVPGFLTVFGTGGPTYLCLYVPQTPEEKPGYQGGGSFANWRAEDAHATHALLTERGVECTPVQAGGSLNWFSFFDPDGNRLDVCEYGPDWLP